MTACSPNELGCLIVNLKELSLGVARAEIVKRREVSVCRPKAWVGRDLGRRATRGQDAQPSIVHTGTARDGHEARAQSQEGNYRGQDSVFDDV